jgi:hypothetical protein
MKNNRSELSFNLCGEDYGLRMFENRVPTWNNIGPKRKDIYLDQRIILR